MGLLPLQRLRSREPTRDRACLTRYVAPPGFSRPPGAFLLPRSPRPCFVPRPLVGFGPSKRFPSQRGTGPLGPILPACRQLRRPGAFTPVLARLPGLAPSGSPYHSHEEVPATGPLLPWASPLQGFPPRRDGDRLPGASSLGLGRGCCETRWPPLRVSIAAGLVRLGRDHRPS